MCVCVCLCRFFICITTLPSTNFKLNLTREKKLRNSLLCPFVNEKNITETASYRKFNLYKVLSQSSFCAPRTPVVDSIWMANGIGKFKTAEENKNRIVRMVEICEFGSVSFFWFGTYFFMLANACSNGVKSAIPDMCGSLFRSRSAQHHQSHESLLSVGYCFMPWSKSRKSEPRNV